MTPELIITAVLGGVGSIIAGAFGLIRYMEKKDSEREARFMTFVEKERTQSQEFYTAKNGQMERVAKTFDERLAKFDETLRQFVGNQRITRKSSRRK